MASPVTEPLPTTIFRTPAGKPASSNISIIRAAVPGVNSAGLKTTVLPATNAGAAFQTGIAHGKFHGVIKPTTPNGLRIV